MPHPVNGSARDGEIVWAVESYVLGARLDPVDVWVAAAIKLAAGGQHRVRSVDGIDGVEPTRQRTRKLAWAAAQIEEPRSAGREAGKPLVQRFRIGCAKGVATGDILVVELSTGAVGGVTHPGMLALVLGARKVRSEL